MNTTIFAHRGASKIAPENTMPAFKLAKSVGAEGLETDVQLTKDNVPVLIHDETLNRTTNGNGYIKNHTYEQLQRLDAGAWFAEKFQGTSILSLDQFLTWSKKFPLLLNIELKTNIIEYEHIESIVLEHIQRHSLQSRTIISSFNPSTIKRFSKLTSEVETALLLSQRIRDPLSYVKNSGAKALHAKYSLLTRRLVEDCRKENMPLRIYTVNRPPRIMRCYKLGCDAIFTDVPHSAIEYQQLFDHRYGNR
ncbi:glycerophosphodiester phosphodiesterase [Pontibacillus salicampi]|uniref:Glycerophosphodiester phosphodiesterase n=1 Tax=Pontibacillus salicampi TaxID=1449801 RepID=A0ABV6LKW2_9BACI